jgi:hypothetical protein
LNAELNLNTCSLIARFAPSGSFSSFKHVPARRRAADSHDLRLDPAMKDMIAVSEMPKSYNARLMRCCPVSTRINHVAYDDECSVPVELAQTQNRLIL